VISFFAAQLLGEVINLGTALATSVKDIAEKYIELTDADPSLPIQVPDRPGQVEWHISSTDKAKCLLGWKAETSLENEMEKTIAWCRDHEE